MEDNSPGASSGPKLQLQKAVWLLCFPTLCSSFGSFQLLLPLMMVVIMMDCLRAASRVSSQSTARTLQLAAVASLGLRSNGARAATMIISRWSFFSLLSFGPEYQRRRESPTRGCFALALGQVSHGRRERPRRSSSSSWGFY